MKWLSSASSLIRSGLLHLSHLFSLLVLLGLDQQFIGFASLSLEVCILSEQQFEVDSRLVKEHTSDCGSKLFTIGGMDGLVNVVTNEVVSIITLQRVELSHIHLRKLHWLFLLLHLLLLLHHLLLSWLLTHLTLRWLVWHLLLTWWTLHIHLHVVVLVTHSLALVVVLLPLVVVTLSTLVATILVVTSLLEVSSTTSVVSTSTVLESLTTSEVLLTIILVSLGLSIETSLHLTSWSTLVVTNTILFPELYIN